MSGGLAEVLAAHGEDCDEGTGWWFCGCGNWRADIHGGTYYEHVAAAVRAWYAACLNGETVRGKSAKAIHAAWAHDEDGECNDPSGCGATVDDVRAARFALAAAIEALGEAGAGESCGEGADRG